jgi:hypothetical protein
VRIPISRGVCPKASYERIGYISWSLHQPLYVRGSLYGLCASASRRVCLNRSAEIRTSMEVPPLLRTMRAAVEDG